MLCIVISMTLQPVLQYQNERFVMDYFGSHSPGLVRLLCWCGISAAVPLLPSYMVWSKRWGTDGEGLWPLLSPLQQIRTEFYLPYRYILH